MEYLEDDDIEFKKENTNIMNTNKMLGEIGSCGIKAFKQWEKCFNVIRKYFEITLKIRASLEVQVIKRRSILLEGVWYTLYFCQGDFNWSNQSPLYSLFVYLGER